MSVEPATRRPLPPSQELRVIAADLVRRMLSSDSTAVRGLLPTADGDAMLAVLVVDAAGPARLLVGPYGGLRLQPPRRIELEQLEVATVARALGSCLEDRRAPASHQ